MASPSAPLIGASPAFVHALRLVDALRLLDNQLRIVLQIAVEVVAELTEDTEIHDYTCTPEPEPNPAHPEQAGHPAPPDDVNIEELAGLGLRAWEIGLLITASSEAVEKHHARELKLGPVKAKIELCRSIHANAVTCKNASLTIFWAKSRFNIGGSDNSDSGKAPVWRVEECVKFEDRPNGD